MNRKLILSAIALCLLTSTAAAQERGLLPQDYYKETGVGEAALSPAGDLVAFEVVTIVEAENRRHSEIWLQRLANGAPEGQPFRFTSPTEESSSPLWSPDGKLLAFTSRRGKDKNPVWFLRTTAPGGEAFHIEGVTALPIWSRDGKWIAFVKTPDDDSSDETDGKDKREGWIAPDAVTGTLDAKRFDGRVITSMRYKRDGVPALLPHPAVRRKIQLFVVAAEGGQPAQLTDLPFSVGAVEWSADGEVLFFTGDPQEDDEYNDDYTSDIFAVSRAGGEVRRLTANPGAERSPAVSPDGRLLAYSFSRERGAETDIYAVEIAADGSLSGEPRNLTADWLLSPGPPRWRPDGAALRFTAGIGGSRHIFELSPDTGVITQVTTGERTIYGYSTDGHGDLMAFIATDPIKPAEAFLARGDGSAERRITFFNDAWLKDIELVPPERLTWTVADGTQVEGWLIKPVGFQPGDLYPMVLKIHGGPHGAYGNYFFRTFHILSAAGFFVLYPNPRGSSNYGHAFTYATRGHWGEMDQEDFLLGVDTALARYREIDPKRVGVSGGSYGGYMTNWLIARTDRFAAAVTSRSIVNWEAFYGASDTQDLTEYEFFGTPWEQREIYRRLSPLSYAENITAPTLIIHSENDYRCPIGDAETLFIYLKKRHVPVELVRYPRSSHGLSRNGEPWLLVDRLERIRSWFVHWLIEAPEAER